ncbi:hypothetical protein AVEN_188-1 [Araneus ventricosus]|uniref:Uncharacterized protein n=1 Tax=Araneus ventricosus TaxID=182803 RepID=A0A4Y2D3W7_ARAVE|nr:hypothetical protein AVEN_188-1 [Araneus ventricosus]
MGVRLAPYLLFNMCGESSVVSRLELKSETLPLAPSALRMIGGRCAKPQVLGGIKCLYFKDSINFPTNLDVGSLQTKLGDQMSGVNWISLGFCMPRIGL